MLPITLRTPSDKPVRVHQPPPYEGEKSPVWVSVAPERGDYLVCDGVEYYVHRRIIHARDDFKVYPKVIVKVTPA